MVKKVVVVGGGPSGMMAAIRASQLSPDTFLVEKNPGLGKKLLLSGKGRCNLTNACDLDVFLERFSENGAFLRDAFKKFFNVELMDFFQKRGLKLKTERQLRVFPVTDKAESINQVLHRELIENKVRIICSKSLKNIIVENGVVKGIVLEDGEIINADSIILATGGASYNFTGSTGDGINIAKKLGHRIEPLHPGLVPLETKGRTAFLLKGLTLKNIRLKFYTAKKEIVSEIGELLFTHFGVSGPLALTLSGKIGEWLLKKERVFLEIDLKPALSSEQLENRLLREFKANPKKSIKNTLKELLPLRMVEVFLGICGIDETKNTSQITQEERRNLVKFLKKFPLEVSGTRPLNEGMVTRGGVSLKDINPRTMESRIIKGLYFAGEIMDIDADTGGFNLQAAFSTGYLAGESAALN
ncbi:NAD(P)/FAD-dependent oxidoreductase [bacterium]|nr:MAG: NAD(P)/FAD-dependent oxidoreductase [bacterium]